MEYDEQTSTRLAEYVFAEVDKKLEANRIHQDLYMTRMENYVKSALEPVMDQTDRVENANQKRFETDLEERRNLEHERLQLVAKYQKINCACILLASNNFSIDRAVQTVRQLEGVF